MTKRIFDFIFSLMLLMVLFLPLVVIGLLVKVTSPGPIIYWSQRVGKHNKLFWMPKFRTMKLDAPTLPPYLLTQPDKYVTRLGKFLRKSSLDELPQLWSILMGKMSFVGPRPGLYNEHELIKLRDEMGVSSLVPGLTGWAQVNGRDDLSMERKVQYDAEYLAKKSLCFDLKILLLTVSCVLRGVGISH